eukprot:Skav233015  [mRNA]  locus=scaffold909:123609:124974:+ [translate_table: standard]
MREFGAPSMANVPRTKRPLQSAAPAPCPAAMPLEFAVFSPDAEKVVTVARDGLVQSWDAVAGKLAQTLVDEGPRGDG